MLSPSPAASCFSAIRACSGSSSSSYFECLLEAVDASLLATLFSRLCCAVAFLSSAALPNENALRSFDFDFFVSFLLTAASCSAAKLGVDVACEGDDVAATGRISSVLSAVMSTGRDKG